MSASHSSLNYYVANHGKLELPSFMVAWIREPVARCYSMYYFFHVLRERRHDTGPRRRDYVLRFCKNFMFRRLRTNYSSPQALLDRLQQYHFIGVTERMDESLVVLRSLMNLTMVDILRLNAKKPGEVGSSCTCYSSALNIRAHSTALMHTGGRQRSGCAETLDPWRRKGSSCAECAEFYVLPRQQLGGL